MSAAENTGVPATVPPVPGAGAIYVTNEFSNSVSLIDAASTDVVTTIMVGTRPIGLAVSPGGNRLYVANSGDDTVSVIDTVTGAMVATVPVGASPHDVAFTPDGSRVYVANLNSNSLSVIDTATNTVIDTIPSVSSPVAIEFLPGSTTAYISNHLAGTVSVLDATSNSIISSISVAAGPGSIGFTANGSRAYIANGFVNAVTVIDTASSSVIATIPVGPAPSSLAVSADGGQVFVANHDATTLSVIETAGNTVVQDIPAGSDPTGVGIDLGGGRLFVANSADNAVVVLDASSYAPISTISTGSGPTGVAAGPLLYIGSDPVTATPSKTATESPTVTVTAIETPTDTAVPTDSATETPTATDTATATDTPTETPTNTATETPVSTDTPAPTSTPLPTAISMDTPTATATDTPVPATSTPLPDGSNISLPARGMFYYPWFAESWTQGGVYPWTQYEPASGYYDSGSAPVVNSHVNDMIYAGVDVAIASWWGADHWTDGNVPVLLSEAEGASLKVAFYYEEEGFGNPSQATLTSDLNYINSEYGGSSAYAKINGRLVIYVYNADDTTCAVVDRWDAANTINAYLVMKVFPGYARCANQPDAWHQYAPSSRVQNFAPDSYNISPGFWRIDEAQPRLTRDPVAFAQNVRDMIASGAEWQLVTSFNEWGEGSGVEDTVELGRVYLDILATDGQGGVPATNTPAPPQPTATSTGAPVPTVTSSVAPLATATATATSTYTPVPAATATATAPSGLFIFTPVADAQVEQGRPTTNLGSATALVVDTSPRTETYLRFNVTGLSGSAQSAKLRLWVTDSTSNGPPVSSCASTTWSEPGIVWNTKPATSGARNDKGAIASGAWVEYDVTPFVTSNGGFCFGLIPQSSNGLDLSSKEGSNPPQLVIASSLTSATATNTPASTSSATPVGVPTNTAVPTATSVTGNLVLTAEADSRVDEARPTTNYGTNPRLRTDAGTGGDIESYLRFPLSGVSGTVTSATLRVYATSGSVDGPEVYSTGTQWTETGITWSTRAARIGSRLDDVGNVPSGSWIELDVTSAVTGNAVYSFVLATGSTDGTDLASREDSTNKPQLVIRFNGSGQPPTTTNTPRPTNTVGPPATMTSTPTATSTPVTGTLFSDGFESGTLASWSGGSGLVVRQTLVATGSWAARGTSTGTKATWARGNLTTSSSEAYTRILFRIVSRGGNELMLLQLETSSASPIISIYVNTGGKLAMRRTGSATAINSNTSVINGAWHELRVRLKVSGATGLTEVFLNTTRVASLSTTANLGTAAVSSVAIGESATNRTFDVVFDDVLVSTSAIAPSGVAFAANLTAQTAKVPIPTAAPTASATITASPTAIVTSAPTDTALPTPMAAESPVPSSTVPGETNGTPEVAPEPQTEAPNSTSPEAVSTIAESAVASDVIPYPVIQTSRSKSTVPGTLAIDGVPGTVWQTAVGGDPGRVAVLRLDLGAPAPIDRLRILAGVNWLAVTVTIEASDDGATWTYFGVPDPGATEAGAWIGVALDAGPTGLVSARYVRIVCVNSGDARTLGGVAEVEVLPLAASE